MDVEEAERLAADLVRACAEGAPVDELAGQLAACCAAGAVREQNLLRALETRQVIGQAVGILIERHRVTAARAFEQLVRASQVQHVKVSELSRRLAEDGEF